jgi:hypothetical protein
MFLINSNNVDSLETIRMTRKVLEQQKESFNDAKQKLKIAFENITEINKEERNPQNHHDKRTDLSTAFAHYTTQAPTYRKYIYDQRKLAKLEKLDQKLENARKRIELVSLSERISGRSPME